MRGLLPVLRVKPLIFTCDVQGPKVQVVHATPDVLQRIRRIECGEEPIPELPIERDTHTLVLCKPEAFNPDVVFDNWKVLRLGHFSAFKGINVRLTPAERTVNRGLIQTINERSAALSVELFNADADAVDEMMERGGADLEWEETVALDLNAPLQRRPTTIRVQPPTFYPMEEEVPTFTEEEVR